MAMFGKVLEPVGYMQTVRWVFLFDMIIHIVAMQTYCYIQTVFLSFFWGGLNQECLYLLAVHRVLVQGICSYLGGSATQEETELAKKNLDHIDQELGATSYGLLKDQEVHQLENDLAVVYYQLGTAVRKLYDLINTILCARLCNIAE